MAPVWRFPPLLLVPLVLLCWPRKDFPCGNEMSTLQEQSHFVREVWSKEPLPALVEKHRESCEKPNRVVVTLKLGKKPRLFHPL